jgi:hypothetical protein
MQRYTVVFITINAIHVSGGSSAHHQELKTVYTASCICQVPKTFPAGKGGWCVRLTTSPPSRAECNEIWEPKPPGTLWATPGLLRDSCTFFMCTLLTEIRNTLQRDIATLKVLHCFILLGVLFGSTIHTRVIVVSLKEKCLMNAPQCFSYLFKCIFTLLTY